MKHLLLILLSAGGVVFGGCRDRYREGAQTEGAPAALVTAAYNREGTIDVFRQQSERVASIMAADLQLTPHVRNQVQQALFNHAIRLYQVRERDNTSVSNRRAKLNNNVGVSNNSLTNPATGAPIGTPNPLKEEELAEIEQETASTLQELLTPGQFSQYQANRDRYTLQLREL
jgi:hypothetical protein